MKTPEPDRRTPDPLVRYALQRLACEAHDRQEWQRRHDLLDELDAIEERALDRDDDLVAR